MKRVDVGDFAVHDFGGRGPVVIMCHATGFHSMVWRKVAEALAEDFHCYALDFRGHGDTPLVSSDTPLVSSDTPQLDSGFWQQSSKDLATVVAGLSDEPILAVGHSMGGACIALAEAAAAGTFEAAWLFEPILFPAVDSHNAEPDSNPLVIGARKRREVFDSREEAIERYGSRPPLNSFDTEVLKDYVNYGFSDLADGTVRLKCRGETEATVFATTISGSLEQVQDIDMPLKIARGIGPGPSELAPHVAEAIKNAELETFTQLSHFGPLEDPELIADSIRSFFHKVTARA